MSGLLMNEAVAWTVVAISFTAGIAGFTVVFWRMLRGMARAIQRHGRDVDLWAATFDQTGRAIAATLLGLVAVLSPVAVVYALAAASPPIAFLQTAASLVGMGLFLLSLLAAVGMVMAHRRGAALIRT